MYIEILPPFTKEYYGLANKLIVLSVETMSGQKPSNTSARHGLQETSSWNQLKVLMRRGYIKTKRDQVCIFILNRRSTALMFRNILTKESGN
jgi:hypothetical protein